jgi:hypothetical protein
MSDFTMEKSLVEKLGIEKSEELASMLIDFFNSSKIEFPVPDTEINVEEITLKLKYEGEVYYVSGTSKKS